MPLDERERARRSLDKLRRFLEEASPLSTRFRVQYSMAKHYYDDAKHYFDSGDYFTSFGCSDYAYGILDAITSISKSQLFPEPTVGAVVLNGSNSVFLMKSHKWNGKYVIPGGHVEVGETLEQALRREIKEETNLDIYDIEHIITHDFVHGPGFWKRKHFIFVNYICRARNPDEVVLNDEAQSFAWMPLHEAIGRDDVEPYSKKALRAALNFLNRA